MILLLRRLKTSVPWLLSVFLLVSSGGCAVSFVKNTKDGCFKISGSKKLVIYDHCAIPGNRGISTGNYIDIDGYRYVNVFVEFEQDTAQEEPLSTGIVFYTGPGETGAGRCFSFEKGAGVPGDPDMISASGKNSWHGAQWRKSSYIVRLPVMGPYMQVFPFNHHARERKFSITVYLTK